MVAGRKSQQEIPTMREFWGVLIAASVIMKSGEHAVIAFSR